MPSIDVNAAKSIYSQDTIFDWLRRRGWEPWYDLNDRTRGEEEPADLQDIDLVESERSLGIFWSGASPAPLNEQLGYAFGADSTGSTVLDDLTVITGYRDQRDEMLRAYTQALTGWIAGRGTGSEEQLLAAFREATAHFSSDTSDRLQGFISRYEHCSQDLEPVPKTTVIEVRRLVSWLSQQDPNMYATVTDDGILALEATLDSVGRLFIEVDRSGAVEATVVSPDIGIRGLNVATISELTSVPIVSLIGGP